MKKLNFCRAVVLIFCALLIIPFTYADTIFQDDFETGLVNWVQLNEQDILGAPMSKIDTADGFFPDIPDYVIWPGRVIANLLNIGTLLVAL